MTSSYTACIQCSYMLFMVILWFPSLDFRSTSFIGNGVLQEYFAKKKYFTTTVAVLQLLLFYCCSFATHLQVYGCIHIWKVTSCET